MKKFCLQDTKELCSKISFNVKQMELSIVLTLCSQSSRWPAHQESTEISSYALCGTRKKVFTDSLDLTLNPTS